MRTFKILHLCLVLLVALSLAGLFTGCKQESSQSTGKTNTSNSSNAADATPSNVALSPSLTSYLVQSNTRESSIFQSLSLGTADEIIRGELLVTNTATAEAETFDWSIYLNEETWQVHSNRTINLLPATYDFSLRLAKGSQVYAGTAFNVTIDDGNNDVPLSIRPVLGDVVTNVNIVSTLPDFKFQYKTEELATLTDPKIGITIDDAAETVFAINKSTGLSESYMNIPAGQHTIRLRFYEGDVQTGKSRPEQETQIIVAGQNVPMDIIPLVGATVLNLNEETGEATFHFNIPAEVVDEAGGIDQLESLFSITTQDVIHGKLLSLAFDASTNQYKATVVLDGFQPSAATMSLAFSDLTKSPKELLGSCTYEGVLTTDPSELNCPLTLRRRAIVGGTIYANLGIDVVTDAGDPIAGAVVYADDGNTEFQLGITGNGAFGTKGYVNAFLKKGHYTLKAESLDRFGTTSVELTPLDVKNVQIILDEASPAQGESCQTILTSGHSTGSGLYLIDPDGVGALEPFEVYCDMDTSGGGWTLYAYHHGNNAVKVSDPVDYGRDGVLNDARWQALRDRMTTGMMFMDHNGIVSEISRTKLFNSSCITIDDRSSLLNLPKGILWHDEKNGCTGIGKDYSLINLYQHELVGASIYNISHLKFDKWGYGHALASFNLTNELAYYLK